MNSNNTLYYTDGQGISVTGSALYVKQKLYPLSDIKAHKVVILQPYRAKFITPMVIGSLIFILGAVDLVPVENNLITILGITFLVNAAVMAAGVGVLLLGIMIMLYSHEKYAVHISAVYGEKDVVISNKREYIVQIMDGLNHAFMDAKKTTKSKYNVYSSMGS